MRDLQQWIIEHPGDDHTVERLAARVAMSPRHFARVFRDEVGSTPAAYVEQVRVEVARRLLETTDSRDRRDRRARPGSAPPRRPRRAFAAPGRYQPVGVSRPLPPVPGQLTTREIVMDIAILLFDRLTALDAIGPYEVLQRLPGAQVRFVAAERGPVRTEQGMLGLVADFALDEVTSADILLVPGGIGTRPLVEDEPTLEWIRAIDAGSDWTTSVCTGSLLLGAAGLLAGQGGDDALACARPAAQLRGDARVRTGWWSRARSSPRPACRRASTWR